MAAEPCVATWEAVEELGDNCPLCGLACYTHEMWEDVEAARAADDKARSGASPRKDVPE